MGSVPFTTVTSGVVGTRRGGGGERGGSLICVPLTGTTVDQMLVQMEKAEKVGADVLEIRLDFLENRSSVRRDLQALLGRSTLPTVVTYRPVWEGGQYEGDEQERQDTLRLAIELGANYIDIELKVAKEFIKSVMGKKSTHDFKIIVSSHNFHDTPATEAIGDLVAEMQSAGADIAKVATTALDITDCANIFRVMVHSHIPMIGMAMGERGHISRILSPKFGGYLTFAAIEDGAGSAPGQLTVEKMLDLYNFRLIRPDTKVYGNVGNPIAHSKSPLMYNTAFKSLGINSVYLHYLVDDVREFLRTYSSIDFSSGGSCTMPFKEVALECMDEIDPIAEKIGAINNIVRRPDGKLVGYNTDYFGAVSAIEDGLRGLFGEMNPAGDSPLAGKLVVVLGAGGAGKAIAFGAALKGARVVVANRTFERAVKLAQKVGGKAMKLGEVEHFRPEEGMVLANATCVGLEPNIDETPIPKHVLRHYCLVFDAIYTPKNTRLLREAKDCGAVTVSGTEMLIRQAFEQYTNFTGLPAPEDLFRELIEKNT